MVVVKDDMQKAGVNLHRTEGEREREADGLLLSPKKTAETKVGDGYES